MFSVTAVGCTGVGSVELRTSHQNLSHNTHRQYTDDL